MLLPSPAMSCVEIKIEGHILEHSDLRIQVSYNFSLSFILFYSLIMIDYLSLNALVHHAY